MDEQQESIDDFISGQFDEMEAAPEVEEKTEEAAPVDPVEDEDSAVDDVTLEADADDATEDDAEDGEPATQIIAAPQGMTDKDRAVFDSLPSATQKWLADQAKEKEADYTRKTTELADQRKGLDKLDQVLAPRRQQLAMDGMDDSTAVGQLFALSDYANQDPVGFVKYLFNQRGIPLTALTESGETTADPQLAAIQQRLNGFEAHLSQREQQAEEQQTAALTGVIDAFAKSNEHYGELEGSMIPIVEALRKSEPGLSHTDYLAKAYQAAMAINPDVQAKVNAKAEADRVAMAKARAAKAKKAAGTNARSKGVPPAGNPKEQSIDAFIGQEYDARITA